SWPSPTLVRSAVAVTRRPAHGRAAPTAAGSECSLVHVMTDAGTAVAAVPNEQQPRPALGAGETAGSTPAPMTATRIVPPVTAVPAQIRTSVTSAAPSGRWRPGPAGAAMVLGTSAFAATGTLHDPAASAAGSDALPCE